MQEEDHTEERIKIIAKVWHTYHTGKTIGKKTILCVGIKNVVNVHRGMVKTCQHRTKISNWVVDETRRAWSWERNDMGWKEVDRHELTVYPLINWIYIFDGFISFVKLGRYINLFHPHHDHRQPKSGTKFHLLTRFFWIFSCWLLRKKNLECSHDIKNHFNAFSDVYGFN